MRFAENLVVVDLPPHGAIVEFDHPSTVGVAKRRGHRGVDPVGFFWPFTPIKDRKRR